MSRSYLSCLGLNDINTLYAYLLGSSASLPSQVDCGKNRELSSLPLCAFSVMWRILAKPKNLLPLLATAPGLVRAHDWHRGGRDATHLHPPSAPCLRSFISTWPMKLKPSPAVIKCMEEPSAAPEPAAPRLPTDEDLFAKFL